MRKNLPNKEECVGVGGSVCVCVCMLGDLKKINGIFLV